MEWQAADPREARKQCFTPPPWKVRHLGLLLALSYERTLVATDPIPTCVTPLFTPPEYLHRLLARQYAQCYRFPPNLRIMCRGSPSSTAKAVHTQDIVVTFYEDSQPRSVHHS